MAHLLHAAQIGCTRDRLQRLQDVSFSCHPASLNLLLGPEDGGNRLFLRILGLLERPDSGEVYLNGSPTTQLQKEELAELRSHRFGYLFPEPFLLPSMGIFENVAMPLFKISGANVEDARQRTRAALDFVGLTNCHEPVAGELSCFDQHRVSLARALVNEPEFLILEHLDESLEAPEMIALIRLVRAAASRFGTTAIFSGTDPQFAVHMDCVLKMGQEENKAAPGACETV